MRKIVWVSLISLFNCVNTYAVENTPIISVYTTKHYPIENVQLANHIYYLDQAEKVEDLMSNNFSENPDIAIKQAQELFQSEEWKKYESELKAAYEGVIKGWQKGIKKVPAILFEENGKLDAVIYGHQDVGKAKQLWSTWREKEKK